MVPKDLAVYRISIEIADLAWPIYNAFDWRQKKVIGDQWITSIDSIGANISEGFGRFHYLDKNKFHYNARGSLFEAIHWTETMHKRNMLETANFETIFRKLESLQIMLNNYIRSTKERAKIR